MAKQQQAEAAAPPGGAAAVSASSGQPRCTRSPSWSQKAAVATYVFFIPAFVVLNVLCLTNKYTAVLWLLYTAYINVGPGRWASKRGTWPKPLRWLSWWKPFADYFPCKLIKTAELDPDQRYIFVVAPHGVLTAFCWPVFDTDACAFSKAFPGIDVHPMTLEVNFRLPFLREFLLLHGVVDASRTACLMLLGKGSGAALLLAVGGAQESLLAQPGTMDLVLAKRKGFVRIALQTGAKLVPVIGFGENELYERLPPPAPGSARDRLQRFLKAAFGFVLPNAIGAPLFWGSSGLMPFARPLNVVVGAPVEFDASALLAKQAAHQAAQAQQATQTGGSQEQQQQPQEPPPEIGLDQFVDAYHEQYVTAFRRLWDEHKDAYAKGRRKSLTIVE